MVFFVSILNIDIFILEAISIILINSSICKSNLFLIKKKKFEQSI